MPKATCYMCEREATFREHVPPAAFFPERKDTPDDVDYRRNLITVPSCPQHNSSKSGDDQYAAIVIAASIQTNEVAQRLMTPKTLRALHYRHGIAGFFDRLSPIRVGPIETGAFFVDRKRFDNVMDHLTRGLFFRETGTKLSGPLDIHTSSLFLGQGSDPRSFNAKLAELTDFISRQISSAPRKGENPNVFCYQIAQGSKGQAIIRMAFYEGFLVDAFSPNVGGSESGDA